LRPSHNSAGSDETLEFQIEVESWKEEGFWIPLFRVAGPPRHEMILTDTRQFGRVPGRKTDAEDCQWIQQLHSCGLL
jgi:hypothetical protein